EGVQPAEPAADRLERAHDAFDRGDIAVVRVEPVAMGGEFTTQALELAIGHIEHDHRPALIEQALRRTSPDTRCSACDGCNGRHGNASPLPVCRVTQMMIVVSRLINLDPAWHFRKSLPPR